MSGIDIFAWFVLILMIVCAVAVFVALAQLPGKTARERNHPQADAIDIASWLGLLLTMGVVWVLAMVWSRMVPLSVAGNVDRDELHRLRSRVAELESELSADGRG